MSVRLVWILAIICMLVSFSMLWYVNRLVQDAPPASCQYFVNALECEKDFKAI